MLRTVGQVLLHGVNKQTLKWKQQLGFNAASLKVFSYARLKVSNVYFKVKWPQTEFIQSSFENHRFFLLLEPASTTARNYFQIFTEAKNVEIVRVL